MTMASSAKQRLLCASIEFHDRPVDLPAELRSAWRGAFLVLALSKCRGKKAAIESLHFLSWAVGTSETRTQAVEALGPDGLFRTLPIRFDLAVNRSLAYLTAEALVVQKNGRYCLASPGKRMVAIIEGDQNLFATEKGLLDSIAPINDSRIRRTFQRV